MGKLLVKIKNQRKGVLKNQIHQHSSSFFITPSLRALFTFQIFNGDVNFDQIFSGDLRWRLWPEQ